MKTIEHALDHAGAGCHRKPMTPAGIPFIQCRWPVRVPLLAGLVPVWLCLQVWLAQAQTPPVNDQFAQRLILTDFTNIVSANNALATAEPFEPFPTSCDAVHKSVWWSYTTPAAGVLWVGASGESNRVVWSVYRGDMLTQLQLVGFSCELPIIFSVQSNETFQIAVDGAFFQSGTLVLNVILSVPPPNDHFTNSVHLEGTNLTFTGNFTAATLEPGEPQPGWGNTVWVSWLAPYTGRVSYHGASSSCYCAPYIGPTVDRLQPQPVVGVGNSVFSFPAVEGTIYHFQFSGGVDHFIFTLSVDRLGPCTNDNFADAQRVKGSILYPEPKSVLGATMELGEPGIMGEIPQKSLWWEWQAPVHGNFNLSAAASLAPNVVLAAYTGSTVETLTLVGRATNSLRFAVTGGQTYHIAGVVPADAIGDIAIQAQYSSKPSISLPVPGNLLREPSWEGTGILDAQYWGMSGSIGGSVDAKGGADGTTWPVLGGGASVWQDFATVPGQNHTIRFALSVGGARVRVSWDARDLGEATIPADEGWFWHWADFTAHASNTTSRITFQNMGPNVAVDAFSVISLTAPPQIITQPSSASVVAGGTAAFIVGVSGSAPLTYTWTLNNSPLTVITNSILLLESVTTNQAGTYQVVIANPFGAVTSAPVTLTVDAPTQPVILWQPYGDTVGAGGYHNFSVVAAGTSPLSYQWLLGGVELAGATNRNLTFSAMDLTNAGTYVVRVQNLAGIVWSLSAKLIVTNVINGGGSIDFRNKFISSADTNVDAPVFDLDGVTRLNGSNFLAQLYGGSSLELLRPVGPPTPFQSGFRAGYFYSQIVTLPAVPAAANAIVQVRAWETTKGSSYEEARALGGKFGTSELLLVQVGGGLRPPANLEGLQSFNLRSGQPQFASGEIRFLEEQQGEILVWSHRGEPGFRYLIEKSFSGFEWRPFLVITNVSSIATFTDSANIDSDVAFYRSRIMD